MKNIRRYILVICMIALILVLGGCGKASDTQESTAIITESVTTTEAITTTEITTEASSTTTTEFVIEDYNIGEQYEANMATGEITTEMPLATGPSNISSVDGSANVEPIREPDPNVDVDLTAYSINDMVIKLNSIILYPDDYLGKTIKIAGPYHPLLYEGTGKYYHYIMIEDETACCESGVEFIWDDGSHTYPDEYPEHDEMIEVVGVYSVYEEEGYTYYYLDTDGYTIVE